MKKRSLRRRPSLSRRRKKVIYVGCEGKSEEAYVALLNEFIKEQKLDLWLEADRLNPGAGDPLELVRKASKHVRKEGRNAFAYKVILLDQDRCSQNPQKAKEARELAEKEGILLLWQDPNHEGFLLRHLPGCQDQNPTTAEEAERRLRQKWPEYEKPMARKDLEKRIDWDGVRRAAGKLPCLQSLLEKIGLVRA
ncbi:RloB domain-containing protein [Methylacidimicrobium tartarophylax]|uniref:RloB domain-containing protein n=1 Tax=Methylacidimicrobium tartarophylax TaxID=1041768 RepID=A0A5E6ML70_9BACT|nr:RloB domain-containing protein [Methylacidimicrobium tartarophylax]VVM06174.1 hypothetical protein MAMT_01024 [Methylacidimicrobium tartarophylax]